MSTRCSALIVASVPTSSVPLPRWLCVASGTSSRMRSTSPSAKPASSSRSARRAAHEPLRARAGVDAPRLDADDAPDALRRRGGDPDQRRDLLRRQPGHRRPALERVLRLDAHLGAQRVLTLDDVRRDVLGERLDEERLADHDLVDRLAEDLGEARHVDALLGRIEVDGARDLGGERLLVALVPDADRLLDAGHPGPGQAELDLGHGGLQVDGPARSAISAIGYNRSAMSPDEQLPRALSPGLPRPAHAAGDGLRLRAHADAGGRARRAQRRASWR